MTVTVTLSENIAERLQAQAAEFHLSLDALVEKLLADALPVYETNGFHAPADDDDLPSLEEVVAMIKATPPNPDAIHPATKTVAQLIAELEANPPKKSDITPEEWDRLWAEFEQELKVADRAKLDLLNPFQQQIVVAYIDSLLKTQTVVNKRDKRRLLNLSVWTEQDLQPIEEAQARINAWQLPAF